MKNSTNSSRSNKGILVRAGESRLPEPVILAGVIRIESKVMSRDTNGELSVMQSSNNPKFSGTPLHVHEDYDETFHVLKGEIKFRSGEDVMVLRPGDTLLVPRGVPHCFTIISDTPADFLIIVQPSATLEKFFIAFSKEPNMTPDLAARLMTDHGMSVVGPPLSLE